MTSRLPQLTVEQCEQITGRTRDHAAHTVYTTRILYHGIQNMPVGTCPGRHSYFTTIPAPVDPFDGLDE